MGCRPSTSVVGHERPPGSRPGRRPGGRARRRRSSRRPTSPWRMAVHGRGQQGGRDSVYVSTRSPVRRATSGQPGGELRPAPADVERWVRPCAAPRKAASGPRPSCSGGTRRKYDAGGPEVVRASISRMVDAVVGPGLRVDQPRAECSKVFFFRGDGVVELPRPGDRAARRETFASDQGETRPCDAGRGSTMTPVFSAVRPSTSDGRVRHRACPGGSSVPKKAASVRGVLASMLVKKVSRGTRCRRAIGLTRARPGGCQGVILRTSAIRGLLPHLQVAMVGARGAVERMGRGECRSSSKSCGSIIPTSSSSRGVTR